MVPSREDFNNCDWKTILATVKSGDYFDLYSAFSAAVKQADGRGQQSYAEIFKLLAGACSMCFSHEQNYKQDNKPFKPFYESHGYHSAALDDFSDEEIIFFYQIVKQIDNIWLKARLADIVWVRKPSLVGQKPYEFARDVVIKAYCQIPLNVETDFFWEACDCWRRASNLARSLVKSPHHLDSIKKIEDDIVAAIEASRQNSNRYYEILELHWLLYRIYKDNKKIKAYKDNHDPSKQILYIASNLEYWGQSLSAKDALDMCALFDIAKAFFKLAEDNDKATKMAIACVESLVSEGNVFNSSVAIDRYDNAIKICQGIPRSKRDAYRVDKRISEIKKLREKAILKAPLDVEREVEKAKSAVHNKSKDKVLTALASLHHGCSADYLQEQTLSTTASSIAALACKTVVINVSRVTNKYSGVDNANLARVFNYVYQLLISYHTRFSIIPALETVRNEHSFSEEDFIEIVRKSPIVLKVEQSPLARAYLKDI